MKADIRIFPNLTALSAAAARLFVQSAADAIQERGRFLVAFSGGNTPMALQRLLRPEPIDWMRVHIFWGDERLVPSEDPESNYGQALETLLMHIPIPTKNIHPVSSELEPDMAVRQYARVLKDFASPPLEWPRFDLVLLGMGEDGHTASLFPGSPVEINKPVMTQTAHDPGHPARRITLTPAVFNVARTVIFLVAGAGKATALTNILRGKSDPAHLPAQRIRPEGGRVIWLVDEAAAENL